MLRVSPEQAGGSSERGGCMKLARRLVIAIGSIVAGLLAGGAAWKIG
jgi:hypothetical protein